ncbi:MAG: hypothetical protein WCA10_02385 [Terracidiphilus sp.]
MQRLSQSRSVSGRSDRSVQPKRRPSAAGSNRTIAPAGITTLAPVFTQALPLLGAVPTTYSHEFRAELLYDLCAALVKEGLGGPETWQKCEGSAQVFAQRAIMESIGEERWNLLQRNAEYHLNVSDVAERDGEDKLLGNGRLAVTIECTGCGFLKVGPAIAALEEESPGLGAAFYWTLTYALYRVMRIYNHDDALQYEERMHEYAEEEEANREQYEFPEAEKALPECIRKTLKSEDHRAFTLGARQLLMKHARGKFRGWIERLRAIQRLSRMRLPADAYFREDGGYDTIPLPSLLVAFKEHDAAVACFDEESQYMLEGSAEPTLGVVFSPQKHEEVRHALRVVGRFIALNYELFQLVEALAEWEKRHAGTCLDRGEPSFRAA